MKYKIILSDLKKVLLLIPYIFILSLSDIFLVSQKEQTLSVILWHEIFGHLTEGEIQTIVMSMESIGFIFLFGLLFGDYISRFWGDISIFVFSRVARRYKWVYKKIRDLCGFSFMYTLILLLMKIWIAKRQTINCEIDDTLLLTLFTLMGTLIPLFLIVSLLVNWVSIRHGTAIGVTSAFSIVLILEFIAILFFDNSFNMILNPLCFNVSITKSFSLACLKVFIEFFYFMMIAAGMAIDIEHMDIF